MLAVATLRAARAARRSRRPRRASCGRQGRGEHAIFHTVYVLADEARTRSCRRLKIKTGISDGISTEVVSGLEEGAKIVTSMAFTGTEATAAAAANNPFGGAAGSRADADLISKNLVRPKPSSSSTPSKRRITPAR